MEHPAQHLAHGRTRHLAVRLIDIDQQPNIATRITPDKGPDRIASPALDDLFDLLALKDQPGQAAQLTLLVLQNPHLGLLAVVVVEPHQRPGDEPIGRFPIGQLEFQWRGDGCQPPILLKTLNLSGCVMTMPISA